MPQCLQPDGSFKLGSVLASRVPDLVSPGNSTKVYYTAGIPEVNMAALAYFAMSMFWRGSIYPWNDDGSVPVEFGPFQEPIRKYLMGEVAFPKECSLMIIVRERSDWDRATYLPVGWRDGKAHFFKFPIPGFAFSVSVSRNLPARYSNNCAVNNPQNPIVVSSVVERGLLQDLRLIPNALGLSLAVATR